MFGKGEKKYHILKKYALLFSDVANFCNTLTTHITNVSMPSKHNLQV